MLRQQLAVAALTCTLAGSALAQVPSQAQQNGTAAGSPADLSAAMQNPDTALAELRPRDDPAASGRFVARSQPVSELLTAIGSRLHKPVQISNRARAYRVSGVFDLHHPLDALERVASDLGLIWYFDGLSLYVYDNAELTSNIISLSPALSDRLVDFLKHSALYDRRFPLRRSVDGALLYVVGPPKYVSIVKTTAEMLQHGARTPATPGRRVEAVHIRYGFVTDRVYQERDTKHTVPGLATALAAALGERATVRISRTGSTPLPPLPATSPSAGASSPDAATVMPSAQSSGAARSDAAADDAARLTVIAYPASNSVLLAGSEDQIAMAKRLIAVLDRPKPQIELSLWIVDISKSTLDALGANWQGSFNAGPLSVGLNTDSLGSGATLSAAQTRQFIATVSALSSDKKARIISRPVLLAQDNVPAVFDNNHSFYVRLTGERDVALQTVTYGTLIDVVPRVIDDSGRIEMSLSIEDGNAQSAAQYDLDGLDLPVVMRTRIDTVARVMGGQSLLIGGYTIDEATQGQNAVPGLGRLPLIGGLFRYRRDSALRSVRLFLIRPRLLPEDERFDAATVPAPADVDDAVSALRAQLGLTPAAPHPTEHADG